MTQITKAAIKAIKVSDKFVTLNKNNPYVCVEGVLVENIHVPHVRVMWNPEALSGIFLHCVLTNFFFFFFGTVCGMVLHCQFDML